jgi:hypothetical protein
VLRSKGHHRHTVLKEAVARADRDEAVATFDLDIGEQEVQSAVVRWLGRLGVDEGSPQLRPPDRQEHRRGRAGPRRALPSAAAT